MSTSLLPVIQTELNRYGLSIIFIFGTIGNSFIIILFRKYRQKSCSMYLFWSSIINNLYLLLAIPPTLYSISYGDLNSRSLTYCKLRFYLTNTLGQSARYFVILVCIDRFILTTTNVHIRILFQPKNARYLMCITFLFWHIFPIHILFSTTIKDGRCNQFGLYYILHNIYLIIFVCFIPLILMSIFGYLTYRNVRRLQLRIQPIDYPIDNHRENIIIRSRERELLYMVLGEVFIHIITILLYPFILLEIAITTYMGVLKSVDRIRIENFIVTIASVMFFINIGSRFYIFFVISKKFRKNFKKFFKLFCNRVIR
ncbi:unnamed protein product [Rotaria sordida]|uniref:G-protein coupled receptors family 1 profile domain-containing protein n=1 Tax=Rotaria sordida TaxID=392033 RepID=A0A814N4K9_9BILA|nr:unnamed protein product [Rotaria sordida]CAF1087783.1 unnamed protein product [Rotaria sordida]CAF1088250.1 unnamed protein product [Rotaria sordida]